MRIDNHDLRKNRYQTHDVPSGRSSRRADIRFTCSLPLDNYKYIQLVNVAFPNTGCFESMACYVRDETAR